MKMEKVLLFCLVACFFQISNAQSVEDMVRYSQYRPITTARNAGVGESIATIGGDYGGVLSNPASLGLSRWNEYGLTMNLQLFKVKTNFENALTPTKDESDLTHFSLPSFFYINSIKTRNPNWSFVNFGIGYNRSNDYHSITTSKGAFGGSIVDNFIENADGVAPANLNAFYDGLAYDAELITFNPNSGRYLTYVDFTEAVDQEYSYEQSGAQREFQISVGANFREKLALGLTIGLPNIVYEGTRTWFDQQLSNPRFQSVLAEEKIENNAGGFNINLGGIWMPGKTWRVALGFRSGTWYNMEETFSTKIEHTFIYDAAYYETQSPNIQQSQELFYTYRIKTPYQFNVGLGKIFKKRGFLSFELNYLNYTAARYNFEPQDQEFEDQQNEAIKNQLKAGLNYKFGGELAIKKWRIRAGAQLDQDAYEGFDGLLRKTYSGGIGFRAKAYVDFTVQYTDEAYNINTYYASFGSPFVHVQQNNLFFMLSVGTYID